VLEGMEEAVQRNETRKFYIIAHRIKAGFQRKMSVFTARIIMQLEVTIR
jgi:hypothetical protein